MEIIVEKELTPVPIKDCPNEATIKSASALRVASWIRGFK